MQKIIFSTIFALVLSLSSVFGGGWEQKCDEKVIFYNMDSKEVAKTCVTPPPRVKIRPLFGVTVNKYGFGPKAGMVFKFKDLDLITTIGLPRVPSTHAVFSSPGSVDPYYAAQNTWPPPDPQLTQKTAQGYNFDILLTW